MSNFELIPQQTITPEGETVDNTTKTPSPPHYEAPGVTLFHGDCLDVLRELPDESVHAVVTDPPYGLSNTDPGHVSEAIEHWTTGDRTFLPSAGGGFMGKAWDEFVPPPAVWDECMRVLKPGGHLLAFAGSRTVDLMALSVRLAGFDIRDSIAWLYGSGFPKSLDVAKAIDSARDDQDEVLNVTTRLAELADAAGITRRQVDDAMGTSDMGGWWLSRTRGRAAVASVENWVRLREIIPGARVLDDDVWRLNGRKGQPGDAWQTAEVLGTERRMNEPSGIVGVGQGERTSVERTLKAPNSDAARRWQGWGTALKPAFEPIVVARKSFAGTVAANVLAHGTGALNIDGARTDRGSWPTNVALDDTQASALDEQSGVLSSGVPAAHHARAPKETGILGAFGSVEGEQGYGDSGGASRFFPTFRYEAKAPTSERPVVDGVAHPTVKPLDLVRWLVRLVTPKGGTVLEPFAGSGTTVEACLREGFDVIAIEREADYLPLIEKRIRKDHAQGLDFDWGDAS